MIKLSHIVKTYDSPAGPVHALKDISLEIARGEIFGIIGLSGAGKSTLIRCINMLERPTSGTVEVDGRDLTAMNNRELRAVRKKIGMIFQHFNLLSSATVYDNVAFPLRLSGTAEDTIRAKVTDLLGLVGLADKAHQYPSQLSGGQKQRVGIARALASDPSVLLCDEATSALDPQTTKAILRLIADINKKLGLTVVVITHEMQVIKDICDKVAVIDKGVIAEQGTVFDIFTEPQQPQRPALQRPARGVPRQRRHTGKDARQPPAAAAHVPRGERRRSGARGHDPQVPRRRDDDALRHARPDQGDAVRPHDRRPHGPGRERHGRARLSKGKGSQGGGDRLCKAP